jgi:hypothetical protein
VKSAFVAGCLVLASATEAAAQSAPASWTSPDLLSRAAFYFEWGSLITSDPRFAWDSGMGLDLTVADFGRARVNFSSAYEAVLGSELRPFELNHGNYFLEGSVESQIRSVVITGAFHHVSRHLSDRPNTNIIAWNVLDARARRRFLVGRSTLDAELAAGHVAQHTFVDYRWTSDLSLRLRRPVNSRVAVFASGVGHLIGVDTAKLGRDRQCGARLEAGVHIAGRAAGLELFGGYERRIDGYPTERTRLRAFTLGFRLVSN